MRYVLNPFTGQMDATGDSSAVEAPTVAVESTATGEEGTQASVTNVGTETDVRLAFVIPKGDQGLPGVAGVDGAQGVPGYSPNRVLSGGWAYGSGGLNLTVSAASFLIGGVQHSTAETDVTLANADPTNERFDVVVAAIGGIAAAAKGASGGTGYAADDTFLINGGSAGNAVGKVLTVSGGAVQTLSILFVGSGYAVASGVTTTALSGGGSGLLINVTAVTSSLVEVVTGVAANPALEPALDPASQLKLTLLNLPAGASAPANVVTTEDIFHEGTEWTAAKSGTPINVASTSNPHGSSAVDVEATSSVTGNYAQFTKVSNINVANSTNLVFYLRSKAAWASTRSLSIQWYATASPQGSIVTLREGSFGFASATTGAYQQIVIPLSLFAAAGLSINRLRFTVAGTGAAIGWYLDDVVLQGGIPPATSSAGMVFKGAWNASSTFVINDVVTRSSRSWVALAPNTNSEPTDANANWKPLLVFPSRNIGITIDGGGDNLTTGSKGYYNVPSACVISKATLIASASGNLTVDVKVGAFASFPTTASICASAKPTLAGAQSSQDATLTGWTKALAANDVVEYVVEGTPTVTRATLTLEVTL